MIVPMKSLILSLALASLAFANDEADVRAAHDEFVKAAHAGDGAALNRLLADGLQYSHSSAKMETKKQAVDALVVSKTLFEMGDQAIHVYGKTATVRAQLVANVVQNGVPAKLRLSMLQVWVKTGKQWQMIERQTTRLP